jgi:hypothetical protein
MSIKVTITNEEIQNNPNNYDLGQLVRNKYWSSIDGQITTKLDNIDTLLDTHIEGLNSSKNDEYDKCVICGKDTPYTKDTHIDVRVNYVEGAGQLCVDELTCGK